MRLFRKLDGLFAVYKPQGVHWKLVRDNIESHLLKGNVIICFIDYKLVMFLMITLTSKMTVVSYRKALNGNAMVPITFVLAWHS